MGKIVSAELEDGLWARLTRFVQASGIFRTVLIRTALEEYMAKYLRENAGVRARYERYTAEDEARAAAPTRGHLTVIK